jgi:hypothetical protein
VKHDCHIKGIILIQGVSEKVLRRILEPKGKEITRRKRDILNDELHNLNCTSVR